MKNQRLIRVLDKDLDSNYDLLFIIPKGMGFAKADKVLAEAIRKVKQDENYIYGDLEAILTPLGFVPADWITCRESW